MHTTDVSSWKHEHNFLPDTSSAEKRTHKVIVLTVIMMVVEITAGTILHSMALLADGWHMSTHVAAFVLTALAYYFGRRHAKDAQFTFGTGKVGVLGGFTSAIVLSGVALAMAAESIHRLIAPAAIHFREAIIIAAVGLVVNIVSALILKDDPHHHHHGHGHDHAHGAPHHDLNMRAAYLHVLADAFTSVLAITALTLGYFFGWVWLDPVMGLVGTVVIVSWAYTLLRDTSSILLDRIPAHTDLPVVIREGIENDGDSKITDLHIWQVGAGKFAAIISVVAHHPKTPEEYRAALTIHEELVHVTVETQKCHEHPNVSCA
ncbi:MAG TPA: CDF family Co(II)/Ni(II) efflux transporter DmeF [Verrucomicrobiae bacterium]|jgi:cation diffusion facilitator family transporter|nr:CDF family Co(II)/Ni(II) efflux transporter DmeF [Verrucomicrobiae bacterium]